MFEQVIVEDIEEDCPDNGCKSVNSHLHGE